MKNHRLITFVILIVGIFVNINLVRSNWQLWQQGNSIDQMRLRNLKLQQGNDYLKKQLSQVESEEFVEKEARDKLNMGKPGETVVIIPDSLLVTPTASESPREFSTWEKWKRLFF